MTTVRRGCEAGSRANGVKFCAPIFDTCETSGTALDILLKVTVCESMRIHFALNYGIKTPITREINQGHTYRPCNFKSNAVTTRTAIAESTQGVVAVLAVVRKTLLVACAISARSNAVVVRPARLASKIN